jgi:protein SCO1/2
MSLARLLAMIGLVVMFPGSPASHAAGRQGLAVEPPRVVQPHKFVDQHAHEVLFPSSVDAWQLVVFGYTHCPDVCPMTLHKTKLLLNELGAESAQLQVVFISIDSTRDDTKAMKEFVEKFDPRIIGLTGEPETLQAVANDFGVLTRRFQGKTAIAYTMVHSSLLYLLDNEGRVQMMYPGGIGIEVLAADLRRLWRAEPTAVR